MYVRGSPMQPCICRAFSTDGKRKRLGMWNKCGKSACRYLFFSYMEYGIVQSERRCPFVQKWKPSMKYVKIHQGHDDFSSSDQSWPFWFLRRHYWVPLLCFDDVRLKALLSITWSSSGGVNKESLAQCATSSVEWDFHVCTGMFNQLRHGETKVSRDHRWPSNCSALTSCLMHVHAHNSISARSYLIVPGKPSLVK